MNADLHCHSTVSDGVLEPEQLAQRAHANGVQLWALTDHDEIAGVARARAQAQALGMQFVSGVEVSVTWAGHTVHILGLAFDETDVQLVNGLASVRSGRAERAREMGRRLEKMGVAGCYEGALKRASNPALVSRTHFARFLLDEGYCPTMQAVFDKYLGEGKPAYVPMQWSSLEQAVGWIRQAGGLAVIAHPGRYDYTPQQFTALFDTFKDLGGVGIEVVTGSHRPDQFREYERIALHYGFLASCGSDFHSPNEGKYDLGSMPALPAGLTPIWRDWQIS